MTAKILPDFQALCSFNSATNEFTVDSALDGFSTAIVSATKGNGGEDPEGVDFVVRVHYLGADYRNGNLAEWARMNVSYSNVAGTITFTLNNPTQDTLASSSGGGAIVFDAGTANLVISGVVGEEQFESLSDVRILQSVQQESDTDYVVTSTASVAAVSDEFVISPKGENSRLSGGIAVNLRMVATVVGNDMRGRASLQYMNSSGAWVDFGLTHLVGYLNLQNVASVMVTYTPTIFKINLSHSQLDANGDWRFRIAGKPDIADTQMQTFAVEVDTEEKTT